MRKGTIRKIISVTLIVAMTMSMSAGCGKKETTEKTEKEKQKNEVVAETTVTAIQNNAKPLYEYVTDIIKEEGSEIKAVSLTYANDTSTIDTSKDFNPIEKKALDITVSEGATSLMADNNVPNVSLTFKESTKEPQDLTIDVTFVNAKKEEVKTSATVNVHVVPESLKSAEALTKNQKLSENLKDYDFDVYAQNIADSVTDAEVTARVKSSDVKFGTTGHYTVVYEVTVAPKPETEEPKPETGDIPVDVEVVDKEQAENDDSVITENVKPGEKPEEMQPEEEPETNSDVAENSGSSDNGSSNNESSNSKPSDNSKPSNNGNSNSKPSNSGSSSSKPSKPSHSHTWVAHTATKKVWVPKLVTVDDYEWQNVKVGWDIVCNCGKRFPQGAGAEEHSMNHILNGELDARTEEPRYEKQKVKVGSHQEDHGSYKTETYTDYNYCSGCGARQ